VGAISIETPEHPLDRRRAAHCDEGVDCPWRRCLKPEVGINGTRGYLADRQARTLTARRIETLSDTRLR